MAKNEFGGIWTRKKLAILEKYLRFYAIALKGQPFRLHYADAFAGTGKHDQKREKDQLNLIEPDDFLGSVETALSVEPGFHEYHFNDLNEEFVSELEKIRERYPRKEIAISQLDANAFVRKFCSKLTKNERAVLFIDPYSTQLDWETLRYVAKSEKVDLWLLFPISVIMRMTPRGGVKPEWEETLNRLLGTKEWQDSLYAKNEDPENLDLFGNEADKPTERINYDELEKWISNRIGELFPGVAKPIPLKNMNSTLFLFYFAVSNPNPKAQALAKRVVNDIMRSTE